MADTTTIWQARKDGRALLLRCQRRREGLKSVRSCLGWQTVDLATLIAAAGPDVTVESLRHRLRCPLCGSEHFELKLQGAKSGPPEEPRNPLYSVPVKDFASLDVKLRAMCRSCGRDRIIEGGLLAREFTGETRLDQPMIDKFVGRLRCGNCGQRNATGELVRDEPKAS